MEYVPSTPMRMGSRASLAVMLRPRRFTVAHELGHLRLHRGRPLILDTDTRVNFRDTVSSMATEHEPRSPSGPTEDATPAPAPDGAALPLP